MAAGIPLRYHVGKDYTLNNTVNRIEIFNRQHETNYYTEIPMTSFLPPFPANMSSKNIPFAIEKQNNVNSVCQFLNLKNDIKNDLFNGQAAVAVVLTTTVAFTGSFVFLHVISEQNKKLNEQRADLHRLENDSLRFQKDAETALDHLSERIWLSDYFTDVQGEAVNTVNEIFDGSFNWTSYETSHIKTDDGKPFYIVNKPVRCNGSYSVVISHKVVAGIEEELFELYEFHPLGTVQNGTYVLPLLEKSYLKVGDKWGKLNKTLCYQTKYCTMKAISYPSCNPSNIEDCEFESTPVDDNFLRFVELDGKIQIVTNIKEITLKSNNISKPIDLPASKKLSVHLSDGDVFIVGNTTFFGKINFNKLTPSLDDVISFCTGTIISRRHILTAGHCVTTFLIDEKKEIIKSIPLNNFVLGMEKFYPDFSTYSNFKRKGISTFAKTKEYNFMNRRKDDIGILEFPKDFDFKITPVMLAKNFKENVKSLGTNIGFGDTVDNPMGRKMPASLMEVNITIAKDCKANNNAEHHFICAGNSTHRAGHGDSGGPLFITKENQRYQIGIVHGGAHMDGTAANNDAEIILYTNISFYCDWIEQITNSEAQCVDIGPHLLTFPNSAKFQNNSPYAPQLNTLILFYINFILLFIVQM